MKVAILNNLYPPYSFGGAEQAAKAQAKKLLREGNEVFIITLAPPLLLRGAEQSQATQRGLYCLKPRNIFNYYNISGKPVWLRFLWHIIDTFNFWLANDIKKILKNEKPDLVICHNLKGLSYLTPLTIKNLTIKNYAVIHDVSLYTPSGLIEWGKEDCWEHAGIVTRIYRFFTRRLMSYPKRVLFPSAWLLNFYRKNGFFVRQEKIYKPNEINFEKSISNQPALPDASQIGQLAISNYFLFVGKLELHKGILLLLDAFDLICSNNPEAVFTLDIIGSGSLMEQIKKRAEKNPQIKIHGKLPREKLSEFYSRADVVIVPSMVYENAPNVVQEALSCGAKAIVSRIGGAYEPIQEGKNGHTFEPGNKTDLAEKIKIYLRN